MMYFIGSVCSVTALGLVMFGLGRGNRAITVAGQMLGGIALLLLSLSRILDL